MSLNFDLSLLHRIQHESYTVQHKDLSTPRIVPHRAGGWLPRDHTVLQRWMARKLEELKKKKCDGIPCISNTVIVEFQKLIEDDPVLYMYFHQMFDQVPTKPPYDKDPTGTKPQIRDYITMLETFELIIGQAPEYQDNDLVGFPINAVLDWPMGTPAGQAAFADPRVNIQFKKMFDVWVTFLTSIDSCYVLNTGDNGWFGPPASGVMPDFVETYKCNPELPYHGFISWDDFFTREFREGMRPIAEPDNMNVINSACESEVYAKQDDVQEKDTFWIKGEPYSLQHMLNSEKDAELFKGGKVYQAFLSATKYHRWHSPVNGKIVKVEIVPGTYYLESPATGFASGDPDPAGPNRSQAFITAMASRAIVHIQADNEAIGMMCMVFVGMAEVSSNEVTVKPGHRVYKGDQIGMFHFGGSTHCLVFRPGVNVDFKVEVGDEILLNQSIATVTA